MNEHTKNAILLSFKKQIAFFQEEKFIWSLLSVYLMQY